MRFLVLFKHYSLELKAIFILLMNGMIIMCISSLMDTQSGR